MKQFRATVSGNIPSNRLLTKTSGADGITLSVANPQDVPEFRSTGELLDGTEITVTIENDVIWKVEAGEDLDAGVQVKLGENGVVVAAAEDTGLGYTTESVTAGELASIVWGAGVGGGSASNDPIGTVDIQDGAVTTAKFATEAKAPLSGTADTANAVASDALAGQPASNISSGTFAAARIPALAQSKITGLSDALNEKLTASQGVAQADSTAEDIAGLVADFNSLLANLRTAGIIASS